MPNNTITPTILTQGDTSTPTVVSVKLYTNGAWDQSDFAVRAQVCDEGGFDDATNATIAPTSGYGETVETHQATKDLSIKAQADVRATETLTVSGVVIDGETVTLGTRVYEFDDDGSTTDGNVAVDISGGSTASQGTLTVDTQPTVGDSLTVGDRTYVFVPDGDEGADGEISIGADLAGAKVNIVAAINGTDHNEVNTLASAAAFSGDDSVITALVGGTSGDAIVTTETFTTGTNVFDAATLGTTTAGVDCIAATAITALVSAIGGDGDRVVNAEDGAGDTVDVTALEGGTDGNALASTETMANGAFGAAVLSGGAAGVLGEFRVSVTNATAETVTLRLGQAGILGVPVDYRLDTLDITHAAP